MTRRIAGGAAAAVVLLLLAAATALAGGWATITPDDGSGTVQPKEDEPVELGFTVLQHGETPAPWERATVIATNVLTGERLEIAATSDGPDGHFTAKVTFPEPGLWSWRVELADLVVETLTSMPVTVLTAEGAAPALDVPTAFRIADLAADRVRLDLMEEHGARLNELWNEVEASRTTIAGLRAQLTEVSNRTATPGGTTPAGDGWNPIVVILLSVLAGAGSAFLMLTLAKPTVSPEPATQRPGYAPTTR